MSTLFIFGVEENSQESSHVLRPPGEGESGPANAEAAAVKDARKAPTFQTPKKAPPPQPMTSPVVIPPSPVAQVEEKAPPQGERFHMKRLAVPPSPLQTARARYPPRV